MASSAEKATVSGSLGASAGGRRRRRGGGGRANAAAKCAGVQAVADETASVPVSVSKDAADDAKVAESASAASPKAVEVTTSWAEKVDEEDEAEEARESAKEFEDEAQKEKTEEEAEAGDSLETECWVFDGPAPVTRPARPLASEEALKENARLHRELAKVRHEHQNRIARKQLEVDFWQRCALQTEVKLAIDEAGSKAISFHGPGGLWAPVGAASPQEEELRLRCAQRQEAEVLVTKLQARVVEARQAAANEAQACAKLRQRYSEQAASLLRKRSAGPTDMFVKSLSRLDAQALLWVRSQIDAFWKEQGRSAQQVQRADSFAPPSSSSTSGALRADTFAPPASDIDAHRNASKMTVNVGGDSAAATAAMISGAVERRRWGGNGRVVESSSRRVDVGAGNSGGGQSNYQIAVPQKGDGGGNASVTVAGCGESVGLNGHSSVTKVELTSSAAIAASGDNDCHPSSIVRDHGGYGRGGWRGSKKGDGRARARRRPAGQGGYGKEWW
eukprot:TRINITY_DN67372_c0_g1_i1.p1 TRINITY_DN67372_c0_g1~~TRINITY_DN67372_c0_g1_i1.p1  ORF type:complete len:541 (+),score=125.40 TRINITY_DN67372_c0_g1_i1:114-1625(+)